MSPILYLVFIHVIRNGGTEGQAWKWWCFDDAFSLVQLIFILVLTYRLLNLQFLGSHLSSMSWCANLIGIILIGKIVEIEVTYLFSLWITCCYKLCCTLNDTSSIFLNFDNVWAFSLSPDTTTAHPESGQCSMHSKYMLNKYTMCRFLVVYRPSCLLFHFGDTFLFSKMKDQLAYSKDFHQLSDSMIL